MSVINKMLRDLDQRQSVQHGTLGQTTDAPTAVATAHPTSVRWPWLVALGGVALLAGSYWAWQAGLLTQYLEAPAAPAAPVITAAPAIPASAPVPATAASD